VPSNTARWVVGELLSHGKVRRRWLGITGATTALPRALVHELDLVANEAVEVVDVTTDGPAARAGVRVGDAIVTAAGRVTTTVDDLTRVLSLVPAGEPLVLGVIRDEQLHELLVEPGKLT
jgi:S1-C subfamily serine protease